MSDPMQGRIVSINVSAGGVPKRPRSEVHVLADRIHGDGRNHRKHETSRRAVSILGVEQITRFRSLGFDAAPGLLGENLTVEGLDVQALLPGTVLSFAGGTILEVTEPRIPCYVLDDIRSDLKDHAWGHIGVMARVVKPGMLSRGERLTVGPNRHETSSEKWPHTAVILAGGKSVRMGRLKEGVALADGRPMIEHVVQTLKGVAERVVVSGECAGWKAEDHGVTRVPDIHAGCGPLSGIHAVLSSGLDDLYLLVACDQPRLSPYLLRVLLDGCTDAGTMLRSETGTKLDPMPGVFPARWRGDVEARLLAGRCTARDLVRTMKPAWITIPEFLSEQVTSLNTPEDLHEG